MRQATFPTLETNTYVLHQQIEKLMGGRGANHYVWSAEPIGNRMTAITIRSAALPPVLEKYGVTLPSTFHVGEVRRFSLVAQCAIRRGEKNNRVAIDVDDDERRHEWLRRRAALNGFEVVSAEIATVERIRIGKTGARHVADRTRFEGTLKITDPEKFANAMRMGIGHGKAFGLGLIDVG
ncbi:type I-E CRISPR-associated protein Cas6/Cse3/CasE [Nordella sp. HKS 07]|uniref:type I-E CRISPR-associated protein Cas6/Cse3/CasE n=1 Tax=Nordella sp. HKS 07 TaxID=2712222 RepID=UPI0013E13B45|nr:type I-E CRISPR-associated protein Cas6/Cse3/CasE [Nordella sp. HKS 07]QIG50381.1 type I-E CRISPR-associated protein Cas6/Cse3/CasE [Nordella sp. HKS 07]